MNRDHGEDRPRPKIDPAKTQFQLVEKVEKVEKVGSSVERWSIERGV